MAGHNRWSKIGKSKAIADQKFGKTIGKFIGEINNAVRGEHQYSDLLDRRGHKEQEKIL